MKDEEVKKNELNDEQKKHCEQNSETDEEISAHPERLRPILPNFDDEDEQPWDLVGVPQHEKQRPSEYSSHGADVSSAQCPEGYINRNGKLYKIGSEEHSIGFNKTAFFGILVIIFAILTAVFGFIIIASYQLPNTSDTAADMNEAAIGAPVQTLVFFFVLLAVFAVVLVCYIILKKREKLESKLAVEFPDAQYDLSKIPEIQAAVKCPECHAKVEPNPDGTCPKCGFDIEQKK